MEVKVSSKIGNLIGNIQREIASSGMSAEKLQGMLTEAKIEQSDLAEYARFEHPLEDGYGRQVIHEESKFEIIVMSWKPGDCSSIHNHGYTSWGVVQFFGSLHHSAFNFKNNTLSNGRKDVFTDGQVVRVNNALIHQMHNPSSENVMTLHVYGCHESQTCVTADAMNFEIDKQRLIKTTGGAFFFLPEESVYDIQEPIATEPTLLIEQTALMLKFLERMPKTAENLKKKERVLAVFHAQIGVN